MIEMQLARGLWRDGVFQREAVVTPLDGWAEVEILEHARGRSAAEIVDQLLSRCVKQIGRVTPVHAEDAATLTIGDRERLLFGLYRASFGTRIELTAKCQACAEIVEFEIAADAPPPGEVEPATLHYADFEAEGQHWRIGYRLPTGQDLAELAATAALDIDLATEQLARRCLAEVSRDGASVPVQPDGAMLAALEAAMRREDPAADGIVDYACAHCGAINEVLVDATTILRSALADGRYILSDVHRLARAYHWPERDILALGIARRRNYLAMIEGETEA